MEIGVAGEFLADQVRADDAVTFADQAAVRLRREQRLADGGERAAILMSRLSAEKR